VVDDGSPEPVQLTAGLNVAGPIKLLRRSHDGLSAARNAGAVAAQGDYLAFTADDCRPAPTWLRELAQGIARTPGHGIGGKISNALPENRYSQATHMLVDYLCSYYGVPRQPTFLTPNNLALPAAPFWAVGGFDGSFSRGTGEDRDFCARWLDHGYRLAYAPKAEVSHCHPLTFLSFLRKHFQYGSGSFHYRRKVAERASDAIRIEPLRFYLNLVRSPLSAQAWLRGLWLAALLFLAQAANGAGFLRQWASNLTIIPSPARRSGRRLLDRS